MNYSAEQRDLLSFLKDVFVKAGTFLTNIL